MDRASGFLYDQVEIAYPKVPLDFLQILFLIGGGANECCARHLEARRNGMRASRLTVI